MNFIISPLLVEEIGQYDIELKVEDNNSIGSGTVLAEVTSFKLTVIASSLDSKTSTDEAFPGLKDYLTSKESLKNTPKLELKTFSSSGLVEIAFSHKMMVPEDISLIDAQVLKLTFEHSYAVLSPETEIVDWAIVSMDQDRMFI